MRPRLENPANKQGWYRLTDDQMKDLKARAAEANRPTANYVQDLLIKHLTGQEVSNGNSIDAATD